MNCAGYNFWKNDNIYTGKRRVRFSKTPLPDGSKEYHIVFDERLL